MKNSPADARVKAAEGAPTHSATTGEMDIYKVWACLCMPPHALVCGVSEMVCMRACVYVCGNMGVLWADINANHMCWWALVLIGLVGIRDRTGVGGCRTPQQPVQTCLTHLQV